MLRHAWQSLGKLAAMSFACALVTACEGEPTSVTAPAPGAAAPSATTTAPAETTIAPTVTAAGPAAMADAAMADAATTADAAVTTMAVAPCVVATAAPSCPTVPPSFMNDVTPALDRGCNDTCHAAGLGPWPLVNYSDVADWAGLINVDVGGCLMPPPDAGAMIASDRATLLGWIACGAPNN